MSKEMDAKLYKIELNNQGDYIEVSTGNAGFFDRFVETYKQIVCAAKDLPRRYEEIDKVCILPGHENKTVEKIKAEIRFCEESIEKIDCVFGQGTLKKYFREHYEKIPDFLPGVECFIDFFKQITPVLEKFYGRKISEQDKADVMSMCQYVLIKF